MLKRIFIFFNINLILFTTITLNVFAEENEKYFMVTAYYSPTPEQKYYSTWNYEDEIKLNWSWIRWASWKPVFSWMLAWPKEYAFWTKIDFEWLWVWSIEDRWWAILSAWNGSLSNDRIDIWVWSGYEWLSRAMYWWRRKVKWTILPSDSDITLDLNKITNYNKKEELKNNIVLINTWSLVSNTWTIELSKNTSSWIIILNTSTWILETSRTYSGYSVVNTWSIVKKQDFNFELSLSTPDQIKDLQEILTNLKYYTWSIDWSYKSIQKVILDFQISKNLIKTKKDIWAWIFGPKTRENLKNEYLSFLEKEKKQSKLNELKIVSNQKSLDKIAVIWNPRFWEVSKWVRELQITLKAIWYFDYKDTATFWETTKNSLISYQLDKKIINSKNDLWAWSFWEKTKESLKNDLGKLFLKELVKDENLNSDKLILKESKKDI